MKQPAFMFYPGDWLKDPCLSLCSPATRGIWIDVLCCMHELRSGSLSGTPDQMARALRCSPTDLHTAVQELHATGAAIVRNGHGVVTLTNRRKEREAKARQQATSRKQYERGTHLSRDCHANVTLASSSSSSSSSSLCSEEDTPLPPKGGRFASVEVALKYPLPLLLQTTAFLQAWRRWLQYLWERRKAPTRSTIEFQLRRCEKMGVEAAIAAIESSITNGWIGLFDKRQDKPASIGEKDFHAKGF